MTTKNKTSLSKRLTYTAFLLLGISMGSTKGTATDDLSSLIDLQRAGAHMVVDLKHGWKDLKNELGFDEEGGKITKALDKVTGKAKNMLDDGANYLKDKIKKPSTFELFKRKVNKLFSCF